MATGERELRLAPELVAYGLVQSFSYMSHRSGHDSLSSIAIDVVRIARSASDCFFMLWLVAQINTVFR